MLLNVKMMFIMKILNLDIWNVKKNIGYLILNMKEIFWGQVL